MTTETHPKPWSGRPRLPEDVRLREVVRLRLSTAELDRVRAHAAASGLTVSDYLRRRVENTPIPRHRYNPALVSEINMLGQRLREVGNLANQLARAVHTGRTFSADWQDVRDAVESTLQDVALKLAGMVQDDDGPEASC